MDDERASKFGKDAGTTDLKGLGESLFKYVLCGIGFILVIAGMLLTFSVFSLIYGIVSNPDDMVASYLSGWEETLDSLEAAESAEGLPEVSEPMAEAIPEAAPVELEPAVETPIAKPQGDRPVKEFERGRRGPGASRSARSGPARPRTFSELLHRIVDELTKGRMVRLVGALILLLLTILLVRIPFGLLRLGVHALVVVSTNKDKKPPPLPKR